MAGLRGSGGRKDSSMQSKQSTAANTGVVNPARIRIIFICFAILVVAVFARLVWLTAIVGPENAQKSEATKTVDVEVQAKRGTIYDRDGNVLACNVEAKTIYCNPTEVKDAAGAAAQLAAVLDGERSDYMDALTAEDTSFAYIYQKADVDLAEKVKALKLDGIYFLDDTKRIYPNGSIGAQIVGVCDTDGNGLTGLELYYNDILTGTNGVLVQQRGANGQPIAGGLKEKTEPTDGQDIVISVDLEMQEYLENRLAQAVTDIQGDGGNAIIYDASNGEILAMSSNPLMDPNDRSTFDDNNMGLTSITTGFEPGSIFKTVTFTAAFEELDLDPDDDELFCPAQLPANEYYVTDSHARGDVVYSLRDVLAQSSNVGTSLLASQLGFEELYDKIVKYNLTDYTGVDYPGESPGYLSDQKDWTDIQAYNVSFGQGIMVTPLQLTRFYGALINDGVECTPHFLLAKPQTGEEPVYQTEKVIENTEAIAPVTSMLQSVVAYGTGTDAQIAEFEPAGKTGTAEIVGEDGLYLLETSNISFVGYLPESNSNLVCFVGVTNVPGDRVTTPAFADIMSFAINHYEISPE